MRSLSISYSSSLALARESRPLITPNEGFERQLGIWGDCGYEVFEQDAGDRKDEIHYREWKEERDAFYRR